MKVTIVGAGIAGLSTAWSLVKRGHAVTLVEQGPIPNPLAASGDHHRIIRRAYPSGSGYGRAITDAYAAWQEMWSDLGRAHHDARGFLCVSREEGDEADDYLQGLREGGFPYDLLDPDEACRRHPFLRRDGMRFAYTSPEGGALHCRKIATDLAAWLRERGVDVRASTRVTAVHRDTGRVVLEDGPDLRSDLVVVTAGAWVTKLFPDLAPTLDTQRTAVAYVRAPDDLRAAWDRAPVVLDVGGNIDGYIIPPTGGAGLKFGTGLHKRTTRDADADRVAGEGEGREILSRFRESIARIEDHAVETVVTCAYTFTADETFFAERRGAALVVSACSGHGYKFGAWTGRLVADCVDDGDCDRLRRRLRAEAA